MFVQMTTPRPVFDAAKYPEYIYVHTLAKAGVSKGSVFFNATSNPEHGVREGREIDPVHEYPIEGDSGFQALEYIIPFFELFKPEDKNRNLHLVPFCSAGFGVTMKSAFRANLQTYEERVVSFKVLMPVTGGGILRIADAQYDITNSTFDPWAPNPNKSRDLDMASVYSRVHRLTRRSGEDGLLRARRIAEAEANQLVNEKSMALEATATPLLEGEKSEPA